MNYKFYLLLPKKLISFIFYYLSRIELKFIKDALIYLFTKITKADCEFAREKDKYNYKSLNDFFTRELDDNVRPIAESNLISPVDGRCAIYTQNINNGELFQAKSQKYSLAALLNSQKLADIYNNGTSLTLYLSPIDYHRVHMPCDGTLISSSFCAGNKHSVALDLLEKIPNLFAGNERLVLNFTNSKIGEFSLIMVGALNVSSISTVFHGEYKKADSFIDYSLQKNPFVFKKGEEIGQFNLGSTVILVFKEKIINLNNPKLDTGDKILMGESLGMFNNG